MKRNSGFTLVEMIVAMGILVVGVSSVLTLLAFGAALQRTAESRNEVSLAAEQVIADLRVDPALFPAQKDGGVAATTAVTAERPVPGHPRLTAKVNLRENPKLPGEYFAVVEIRWPERGKLRSEAFRTILQREAPFDRRVRAELEQSRQAR